MANITRTLNCTITHLIIVWKDSLNVEVETNRLLAIFLVRKKYIALFKNILKISSQIKGSVFVHR